MWGVDAVRNGIIGEPSAKFERNNQWMKLRS